MSEHRAFDEVIRKARRRSVWILLSEQGALAMSILAGGAVALLVVGTRILDWPWLVFLFAGSLVYGLIRVFRRLPVPYHVAQRVDQRLDLQDTLSTAFFFRRLAGARRAAGEVVEAQQQRAEGISRSVDLKRALPLAVPRALGAAGLLAVAALGLFGLRYLLTQSLDLRPPIVRAALFDVFRSVPRDQASPQKSPLRKARPGDPETPGVALEPAEGRRTVQTGSETDNAAASVYEPGENKPGTPQPEEISVPGAEGAEDSEGASGDPSAAPDRSPSKSDSANSSKAPPSPRSENSSLLAKLRDAMADLLARMKMQPPAGEARQPGDSQDGLRTGQKKQTASQKGAAGSEKQPGEGSSGDEQADREGEANSQGARGKSGERASGQRGSGEERSGMGKEEGSKELRDAQQLAAMGKISEIIGKRSANMTGEAMVEVRSSREQTLKTPYADRQATHSGAGGEIHRDEVPLIFQNYVERYFEQVRKAPPPR